MKEDLTRNPVAKYDITRRLNVFSSRVVFIEFSMKNSSLSRKQVRLPPHPEQGFRSCLGILRLARSHGAERLEAACDRALEIRAP